MLRIFESQALLSRTFRSKKIRCAVRPLLVAVTVLGFAAVGRWAQAAIIYGDFPGATVDYLGVTEDSNSGDALPLFGEPTVSGDSLDFDPVGFSANASGAAGNDVTDGNLKFMVKAHAGKAINTMQLREAGDTTLAGFGTDMTYTSVTATGALNVSEVDGVGIPTISKNIALTFTPSGGTYGLLTDGGGGPHFSTLWTGTLSEDINQILMDNAISFVGGATKISIDIDNTLTALSQEGTFSFIAKKDFGGLSVTVNGIPEPATWALVAICGLFAGLYKRSR
jgi:hypothetical protein